jgi:hypothetical protein
MFASSPAEVAPTVRPSIACKSIMITLFLTANGRAILDTLPKGSKSNHDYLIDNLLPALSQVRTGNDRHKVATSLNLHMDNSMCHDGATIAKKMSLKGLGRAPHPTDSPYINPSDFWVFERITRMITDPHLQGPGEILRVVRESMKSFHFRRLLKCLQVADGTISLGDCKQ